MKNPLLASVLLLALCGGANAALLDPAQVDASRLLPPPPAAGSPDAKAEIAELHAIAARSTPQMIAAAARDAADQKPALFNSALGFDVTALPATNALLNEILEEDVADSKAAKTYFHRNRPWVVDPTISTCVPKSALSNEAYPSGHTIVGFSMGVVLASLLPAKSQAILARAAEFAENRLVCGFHVRSDIVAGQAFGTLIGLSLMQNAAFKKDFAAAAAELKAANQTSGSTFRDCASCAEMVTINAGSFVMGAPSGEEERENVPDAQQHRSIPQHLVTLHKFALAKFDVTRAEFSTFVAETGYQTGDECSGPDNNGHFEEHSGLNWRNPGFKQTDRDPVVCVDWDDAQAYVAWLSRKTGQVYRLPSEAEWEYAARAGTSTARYWADGRTDACRYANVGDLMMLAAQNEQPNPDNHFDCTDRYANTAPVGSFPANAFGLYDMLGNVWQWTGDCWNGDYNGAAADGTVRLSGDCGRRVLRGGSWRNRPRDVRSAVRGFNRTSSRLTDYGFRVARNE